MDSATVIKYVVLLFILGGLIAGGYFVVIAIKKKMSDGGSDNNTPAPNPTPGSTDKCGWTAWTDCNKPCGGGTQTRQATKETCEKELETRACNTQACIVDQDCQVTWSDWSACSQACGDGVQIKTATIVKDQQGSGTACPILVQKRDCNQGACPTDCKIGAWSEWSKCSTKCGGGTRERTRTVGSTKPECGPDKVSTRDIDVCNTQACPQKVDCELSPWSDWDKCDAKCTQTRKRTILRQASNGGKACPSTKKLSETRACFTGSCPCHPTKTQSYDAKKKKCTCKMKTASTRYTYCKDK